MIEGTIQEEVRTVTNLYVPSIRTPQYIRQMLTTTKGEILARYNVRYSQFETDILLAITNAINLVTSNPHHNEED